MRQNVCLTVASKYHAVAIRNQIMHVGLIHVGDMGSRSRGRSGGNITKTSSSASAGRSGIHDSAFRNLDRLARWPGSATYSSVINAAVFSAAYSTFQNMEYAIDLCRYAAAT